MKLLDLTLPTPAENLACDEALLDTAEAGSGNEVLRFWESPEYFVVVGYANKVAMEVNVAACEVRGIPILRRCSGGGTVVQGPGCLNYALVLRIAGDGTTRDISAANRFIMERIRAAMDGAGRADLQVPSDGGQETPRPAVAVCGHTDLALSGLKFSGNSQRRRREYLLFHGTFLLNFDLALVGELLALPSFQPDYRASRAHGEFITNLGLPARAVKTALSHVWKADAPLNGMPGGTIQKLVVEKYSTTAWNFKF